MVNGKPEQPSWKTRQRFWQAPWFGCVFASIKGEMETYECFYDNCVLYFTNRRLFALHEAFVVLELKGIWFCRSVLETAAKDRC